MNSKIMFVDDEINVLKAISRQFDDHYDLHFVVDPAIALSTISHEGPFAVVLSDMQMPGISGVELLTQIHHRFPTTYNVLLTGYADERTVQKAVQRGAIARVLAKPCCFETVELTIRDGIQQHIYNESNQLNSNRITT